MMPKTKLLPSLFTKERPWAIRSQCSWQKSSGSDALFFLSEPLFLSYAYKKLAICLKKPMSKFPKLITPYIILSICFLLTPYTYILTYNHIYLFSPNNLYILSYHHNFLFSPNTLSVISCHATKKNWSWLNLLTNV